MASFKVCMGVCVRNGAKLIEGAIRSIANQDFPHEFMEVIFVDDGSEDNTLSIINRWVSKMDMRTKVFHQGWKGLGAARNVVVNNTESEYIVWVDCDMEIAKDFVRRQVDFMDKNRKVAIAKGKYGMSFQSTLVADLENMEFVLSDFVKHGSTSVGPLGTGGCIYRTSVIKGIGGFDEAMVGVTEDMDAERRISESGWRLSRTDAVFYETRRGTWRSLWNEYYWHGYGGHYFAHKNTIRRLSSMTRFFPPSAIVDEVLRSRTGYKLTGRKMVFLLPLHWVFKRTAWSLGFVKSHVSSYGHLAK